jgi:hypothetical protein
MLLAALNNSFTKDDLPENCSHLHIYRGKEPINSAVGASTSLNHPIDTKEKNFVWSRGISTELSPLQTRSSRKKKETMGSQQAPNDSNSQNGKALRALKALARSKS